MAGVRGAIDVASSEPAPQPAQAKWAMEAHKMPKELEQQDGGERCERGACPWRVGGWIELGASHYRPRVAGHAGVGGAASAHLSRRRRGRTQPQPGPYGRADRVGGTRLCGCGHSLGA